MKNPPFKLSLSSHGRVGRKVNWPVATWANWVESDGYIANLLGCSPSAVAAARRRLNIPSYPHRGPKCRWVGVDWTRSNEDLAKERGVSIASVTSARSRYAPLGVKPPPKTRKPGKRQARELEIVAKLSERKTVHEWLNLKGIPREEGGRSLCLLRRLAIALEIHDVH